jgi:sugar phosphate isomerase/epimerase
MEIGSNQDPFFKPGRTFESMIKDIGNLELDLFEICPEYEELGFETLSPEKRSGGLELAKSYDVGFTVHAPWCEPLSTISSVNVGIRREFIRQVEESLKLAYDLEAPVVTVHGGAESLMSYWYPGRAWENMVASLKEALELASELGVDLCVENLPVPYGALKTLGAFLLTDAAEFCRLFEEIGHERLKVTFDFGHANIGRGDIDGLIDRLGERFGCLHIHDNDGSADQHLPIGQGTINFPKYLKKLEALGYRRPYILEHTSIDHIKASRKALEGIKSTF